MKSQRNEKGHERVRVMLSPSGVVSDEIEVDVIIILHSIVCVYIYPCVKLARHMEAGQKSIGKGTGREA